MREEYLHFLWKYKRFTSNKFTSIDGQLIEIIDFGFHNLHSGPDFQNGRIRMNTIDIVGSIEFHLKSSDWYAHNHDKDPAYNNVVLHVVLEHNEEVLVHGVRLPTIELKELVDENHLKKFESHLMSPDISCAKRLPELSQLDWVNQLDGLSIERIERKLRDNKRLLKELNNDYNKLFNVLLGRSLGGKVNGEGFELLSYRISSGHLTKLSNENHKFEAYILGLSGMLTAEFEDAYPNFLKLEWQFLKVLLDLDPIDKKIWRYGRLRPKGFPLVRLIQFTNILMVRSEILEVIEDELTVKEWFKIIDVSFNGYWTENVSFDKKGDGIVLSSDVKELILVNTILPFRSLILSRKGIGYLDYYVETLSLLRPEKNHIIKKWTRFRGKPLTMFDSQGLIELYNEHCLKKQCLNCKFGVKFMN